MSSNTIFFFITLAVAIGSGVWLHDPAIPLTKKSLLRAIQSKVDLAPGLNVAVGYNSCLDLVSPALSVLSSLSTSSSSTIESADHATIDSVATLESTFLHFFEQGAAAERVVSSETLFKRIVKAAREAENPQMAVGGNAALMAMRFAELPTSSVLLGGHVGPDLGRLLGPSVRIAGPPAGHTGDSAEDEVHVILEYSKGAVFRGVTAPRANRFIVTHDHANGRLTALESLHAVVNKAGAVSPSLFVATGLHMLDAETPKYPEFQRLRTAQVAEKLTALRSTHAGVPIHLELASIAERSHLVTVADGLFPSVDSIGLNEQELAFLFECLDGKYASLGIEGASAEDVTGTTDSPPKPHVVSAVIRFIMETYPLLTRVHFHALQFHIVVQRKDYGVWTSAASSVAAGSAAVTLKACDVSDEADLHGNDLDLLAPLSFPVYDPRASPAGTKTVTITADAPVARWRWAAKVAGRATRRKIVNINGVEQTKGTDDELRFAMTPVLVCKNPYRTVGLGDAISATGLVGHLPAAESL